MDLQVSHLNLSPLILIALSLGVIVRLTPLRRVGRFLLGLIFIPILTGIAWFTARILWNTASPFEKLLILVALPFLALTAFAVMLPTRIREDLLAHFLYDVLRGVVRVGTRLLRAIFSLFLIRRRP